MKFEIFLYQLLFLLGLASCAATVNQPKFLERIPNVNVTAGREVSLPCVVDNIGKYNVAWTHINRQLLLAIDTNTVTLIPRFWVTREDVRTWTLHIRDVEPEDTGYYVCQVNMEPIINQVGFLQVVVPPVFLDNESSPSHVEVQENLAVTLVCKTKGVPPPSITWTREDGRQLSGKRGTTYPGEELKLKAVTRQDMGAYLCISSNKVPPSISKRIVLDVHFSPVISVPNQLVGAPVGTSVTLECRVSAFPKAIHYWQFQGNLLINSTRQQTTELHEGFRTTLKLLLHNLRKGDFGTYICGSKNSLGETESNLKLYEIMIQKKEEKYRSKADKSFNADSRENIEPISSWNKNEIDIGATSYTLHDVSQDEFSSNEFDFLGQRTNTPGDAHGNTFNNGANSRTFGTFAIIPNRAISQQLITNYLPRLSFVFLLFLYKKDL